MSLTIRTATPDDVDRIVLFNQAMARETEGRELDRSTLRSGVEALLADPAKGTYYLAEKPDGRRDAGPDDGGIRADGRDAAEEPSGGTPGGEGLAGGTPTEPAPGVDEAASGAGPDEAAGATRGEPEVVGQLLVTTEWSDWRDAPVWWIQSVYVSRKHRREGIYRALHEHVRQRARQEGAAGLRLYVDRDNRPAQTTYEELGMRRSHYVMFEEMWM